MVDKIDAPEESQPKNELDFVRTWLDAIEKADKEEKDWRDLACKASDAYRGGMDGDNTNLNTFNLFHANVETLVPALYNSTPIPDVRRRFNDDDPVAKEVSELYERALSYQVDAYDFDQTMLASVRDMGITSRGLQRVRYEPYFGSDGNVSYEMATCEYVSWRTFRRGPGRVWRDVPWIAFELLLSYSEVEKLLEDEKEKARILKEMRFTYTAEAKKGDQADADTKIGARAHVWEIWDKDNRQVHFISKDFTSRRLTTMDDPLELKEFFPIPRPLSAIGAPDSLVPITLLQIYESLLEELNIVQRRIMKLTNQLRARGWYAGLNDTDIQSAASAEDGELTPLTGVEAMMASGTGIDKAITYWPIETIAKALEGLVQQRELIKQTIYEVTGLSDIVRGATDPSETATAQQLKSQWGSLRIQRMQAEVARFARDLFRLKAEIMAKKFSFDTVLKMSSLSYPTMAEKQQAQQHIQIMQQVGQQPDPNIIKLLEKPAREEVEKLFKETDLFRVDIESDSTIRGDLIPRQEQQSLFLQGTAQFLQAVGPMVQEGVMPPDVAVEIYAGFARSFRLGKQAEDAIDRLADQVRQAAGQPKPPSPEEVKAQAEKEKMALEREKMAHEKEMAGLELQIKERELELKAQEMQMKMQLEQAKAEQELQLKQIEMEQQMQLKAQEAEMNAQIAQSEAAIKQQTMQEQAAAKMAMDGEHHQMKLGMEQQKFGEQQKREQISFAAQQKMMAEAHAAEQKRKDQIAKAESAERVKHENGIREKEAEERKASRSKPKEIIIKRDKDKRMSGATVQ